MARASEDERLPTPVLLAARGIAARTSCLDAYLVYVLPHGFSPRREPARTSTESKTRLKKISKTTSQIQATVVQSPIKPAQG